jgi:hypothetical protein
MLINSRLCLQKSFSVRHYVKLNWDVAANAVHYTVKYRIRNSGNAWTWVASTSNQKYLLNLTLGTEYEYRVKTKCPTSKSEWTTLSFFTTSASRFAEVFGEQENNLRMQLFPNPVKEMVSIIFEESRKGGIHLEIMDVVGKQVKIASPEMGTSQFQFDVSDLQPGYYFVRLRDGRKSVVEKLVISH